MSLYCLHFDELIMPCERFKTQKFTLPSLTLTVKIQKVSHFRFCSLFRFTVLSGCFSVARSDLSANIATFVFEMTCFNKGSVFQ